MKTKRSGPLIGAGSALGFGLGGFLDGIFLHQILQRHHMISRWLPPDTLIAMKTNMFWDGIFHLGTWLFTALGIYLLWRLAGRTDVAHSQPILLASMVFGWGLFNVIDSVFNHYLSQFHNVREGVAHPWAWNLGFLILGLLQMTSSWRFIEKCRRRLRSPSN